MFDRTEKIVCYRLDIDRILSVEQRNQGGIDPGRQEEHGRPSGIPVSDSQMGRFHW